MMDELLLLTWRLPPGEPDWARADARLAETSTLALVDLHARWARLFGAPDVECALQTAIDAAQNGIVELKRAHRGHQHAAILHWPDGTRLLCAGGSARGARGVPFAGWADLCFVVDLGIPESMGWELGTTLARATHSAVSPPLWQPVPAAA